MLVHMYIGEQDASRAGGRVEPAVLYLSWIYVGIIYEDKCTILQDERRRYMTKVP